MLSLIVVHPQFDSIWPFAADHLGQLWSNQTETDFIRLTSDDSRSLAQVVAEPERVNRIACFGVPFTIDDLKQFTALQEATFHLKGYSQFSFWDSASHDYLKAAGVRLIQHTSEGFWGESVAEFGLALTLSALRRIPQNYHAIMTDLAPWKQYHHSMNQGPGTRGQQFSDDTRFTHGTVAGRRVRIVGSGNIGSRYASFCNMMGADVATWDPFAPDPTFHRSGSRREWHLDSLISDAEIFAPMLPLTENTTGLITAQHIDSLPRGCLVVLVTRARICDVDSIRRRVLNDEISLAADVFDIEPLPLNDPLLGRDNVIHTPHLAGRTQYANQQWAEALAAQFLPVN
jgi:phosphoglycerate dehydrogenase-like enzyme